MINAKTILINSEGSIQCDFRFRQLDKAVIQLDLPEIQLSESLRRYPGREIRPTILFGHCNECMRRQIIRARNHAETKI